jgi:hypothetical protein
VCGEQFPLLPRLRDNRMPSAPLFSFAKFLLPLPAFGFRSTVFKIA